MDSLYAVFERVRAACAEEEESAEQEGPAEDRVVPPLDFAAAQCGDAEKRSAALAAVGEDVRATLEEASRRALARGGSHAVSAFLLAQAAVEERPWWRPVEAPCPCDAFRDRAAEMELFSSRRVRLCGEAFGGVLAAVYLASFQRPQADVYRAGMSSEELLTNYSLAKQCALSAF
jgi:hypothetical protein